MDYFNFECEMGLNSKLCDTEEDVMLKEEEEEECDDNNEGEEEEEGCNHLGK